VRKRFLFFGFVVALAVGLLGFPSTAAAWSVNNYSSASEKQLFSLHNQARAAAGRKALKWDSALQRIARKRSKDMIVKGYFSHKIPPDGHLVFSDMKAAGYCFRTAGENIGWNNYPDDIATVAIHESFMSSSGHRSLILSSKYDVVGIGAYKGPTGKKMWTVLFADKCGGGGTSSSGSTTKSKPKAKPAATPKPKPKATPTPTPTPAPTLPPRDPNDPETDEIFVAAADPPPSLAPPQPPGALRVRDPSAPATIVDALVGTVMESLIGD
jgi:uncharacterized protein YkwD